MRQPVFGAPSRGRRSGVRAVLRISGDYIAHSKYMMIEGTYAGVRDSKWAMR
ncbi:hypothetical protein ACQEVC_41615 [Plantactinospora sp. CA-294935]|uniref:hypothetical protein n=1 Tax=Plantactinospora sp. CA-294935 TaxID=3240012 RepID=UPI003D8E70B4